MGEARDRTQAFINEVRGMILDTNILIAYLNGERAVVDFVLNQKEAGRAIFVSSVSVAELLSLPALAETDIRRIKDFLGNFISVPLDDDLAEAAAALRRAYKLSIPDAAIAATALVYRSPLITRDKGLKKVTEIAFIDL